MEALILALTHAEKQNKEEKPQYYFCYAFVAEDWTSKSLSLSLSLPTLTCNEAGTYQSLLGGCSLMEE